MRFDEFDEYIQERWEGMLELLEAKNKNGLVDKYNKFVYKQAHKSVTNHYIFNPYPPMINKNGYALHKSTPNSIYFNRAF